MPPVQSNFVASRKCAYISNSKIKSARKVIIRRGERIWRLAITKTVIEATYEAEQPTKPGLFNLSVKFRIESNFCRSKVNSVCLFISVLVCFEDHWKMT